MIPQFTVLASGSSGNASLLRVDGFGVLIDAGIGPRQIATRLAASGLSWDDVQAVLLSHTHSDHWNERTLTHLLRRRIPLYCHAEHRQHLSAWSAAYTELQAARLVRKFEAEQEFRWPTGLCCRPFSVAHDSGATFGFRMTRPADLFGRQWSLAYASDLGCWDAPVAEAMSDVDVLAVEFNHDVALQRASGRSARLIERVLGDEGHLSNEQAADLLRQVISNSSAGRLRHVVQLHLSRDCNRPALALTAAQDILQAANSEARVHTALQHEALLISGLHREAVDVR